MRAAAEEKQEGYIIHLTGISGSGKTTLGRALRERLERDGTVPVEFIDGDTARDFLESTSAFSPEERSVVTKQIAFAAHLLAKHGITVIVANIAGSRSIQRYLEKKWRRCIRVFLDARIEDCMKHDPKKIYSDAAREGSPLYAVDIPYENPLNPDVTAYPYKESVGESLERILLCLREKGVLKDHGKS